MPDLLLELGCEELPASAVCRAHQDLRDGLVERLSKAGLNPGRTSSCGTPRRLIVSVTDISDRQEDRSDEVRGPAVRAAYDEAGKPTKALEGFCRGQGVDPSSARAVGEYVFITKSVAGRSAIEVLSEIIPETIRSLSFDKTMRWGSHRMRFARPIRWILAAFGGAVIPFEVEGVRSGLESRGHRFNHPGAFSATTYEGFLSELRKRDVEPDEDVRKTRIREGARSVSELAEIDEKLVEENAYLTESPHAVLGSFDARYLELPEPVLVTVMAKHERFFPVRQSPASEGHGGLTNQFVSIRNGGIDEVVSAGNAWVLNCRFNDAKFFFDEDKKHTLDEFLEKTEGIVFQADLGTVRQRADRLARLCEAVAVATGADAEEIAFARLAGLYAKADLSTGLVGELDELQGVIGGIYANREGLADPICWAIRSQYAPDQNLAPDDLRSKTALRLIMADQLDKLAGYLGLNLTPSGSSDPYGLRRAAGIAMEGALRWTGHLVDLRALLESAQEGYHRDLHSPISAARDVFRQRSDTLFPDARPDVLEAVLADPDLVFRPAELRDRLQVMTTLAEDVAFVQAATRPLNIVAAAAKKGITPVALDEAKLQSPEGLALLEAARRISGGTPMPQLRGLQGPIDAFFESTMVMVDDAAVRDARLAMLREVGDVLLRVGDFSKLVIPG